MTRKEFEMQLLLIDSEWTIRDSSSNRFSVNIHQKDIWIPSKHKVHSWMQDIRIGVNSAFTKYKLVKKPYIESSYYRAAMGIIIGEEKKCQKRNSN